MEHRRVALRLRFAAVPGLKSRLANAIFNLGQCGYPFGCGHRIGFLYGMLLDMCYARYEEMARLSPRDPLLLAALYMTGWAHFSAEEYLAGCAAAQKSVQGLAEAHSLAAFAANAVRAGRVSEARQAAENLMKFQPAFRASHAHYMYPIRSLQIRNRIQISLREAGVPE